MPGRISADHPKADVEAPIIDFAKYTHGNEEEREKCSTKILESLTDFGFARVINSGIDASTVDRIFELSRQFFLLPREAKEAITNPRGPNPQRGYSHVGAESSSALYAKLLGKGSETGLSDAREHWDQGPDSDTEFPNRWLEDSDLPGFKPLMQSFFKASEDLSNNFLQILEEALKLQPGTFTNEVQNASELRLNHYPAISLEQMRSGSVNRIWPHFDLGVLTLLWTRGAAGLEFGDRSGPQGSWVPVQTERADELVISTSETFQRWTNDVVPAALHQVSIPPHLKIVEDGEIEERYSVAFFCKADRSAMVGSMEPFVSKARPAKYPDMTALEYHQSRLKAAY